LTGVLSCTPTGDCANPVIGIYEYHRGKYPPTLGKRSKKGIFISTTRFTDEAIKYAQTINTKVVLIDGAQLTDLMIDYGVGVSTRTVYEIKSLDTDYFGESSIEE